jgi:hypothetical protein
MASKLDSRQTFYPSHLIGGRVELATGLLDDIRA